MINYTLKPILKRRKLQNLNLVWVATIEIDSAAGTRFEGIIRNISPTTGLKFSLLPPENATGNFTKVVQRVPVIIDFTIPDAIKNKIVPGMSTLIKVRIDQKIKNDTDS